MTKRFEIGTDREFTSCFYNEVSNELYKEGYRYICKANPRTETVSHNGWGFEDAVVYDLYAFNTKEEAEIFSENNGHYTIDNIPEHRETLDEIHARKEEEAKEKSEKKLEIEARRAAKNGLTVEQYRKRNTLKRVEKELEELERQVENKKHRIAHLKNELGM